MSKGMLIYIITMGWTLVIYGGITFLIIKQKNYDLISGFARRPKEEQEYLKENGYIEKLGKIMLYSFNMLVIATILPIFKVPYGIEIGFGLFTIFLLGGLMYLQKFEVPSKRKKMFIIIGGINVLTLAFIAGVFFAGNSENEILVENDTFIISGMYGVEWSISAIEEVRLLDELPKVLLRKNGFSSENSRKGVFKLVEPYGDGRLFVSGKEGPFLYIATEDDYVILNRGSEQEVKEWYERLMNEL